MSSNQPRVLVVDDERFFREMIRDVLTNAGLASAAAATGADGLELAAEPAIGAVILDLQLPDMHGLEVLARLRKQRPELRVLILSASADEENVLEALRLGAFDYLVKPLHEEELLLAVRRALDSYGAASGWQSLKSRVDRLQAALGELWERTRAQGATPDDLRGLAVRAAAEVLGAARTSLLLLDENAAQLRVVAAVGNKVATDEMDAVPVGQGVAGLALARSEPLLVADVSADERFASRQAAGVYASSSFAVAPLVAGARTLGVLCATERSGGSAFDSEDLALLRILAGQVAHMLAAPQPPPAAQAAPPELETDDDVSVEIEVDDPTLMDPPGPGREEAGASSGAVARAGELAREVCEAVTAEVEPARILEAALEPVSAALGAAPVAIYLRDAEQGDLVREAECDGGRRSDRARLPLGKGLAGSVLGTGQLVATGDPTHDPRFDAAVDTPEDGVAGPLLCGALRFRGKPIGLYRAFPAKPEDAAPELGELLSAALSAAVRNVLLYRSLVQTIEDVAEARRGGRPTPQ